MSIERVQKADVDQLLVYLNSQQDMLLALIKHYRSDITGPLPHLNLEVSSKGEFLELNYHDKQGKRESVKIELDPPLKTYRETRGRVLAMRDVAFKALGVPENPTIKTFTFPPAFPLFVPIICLMALQAFTVLAPIGTPVAEWIRGMVRHWGGPNFLMATVWFLVFMHSAESLYTLHLCNKHDTPFVEKIKWVVATLAFGYPVWTEFRTRVQKARMEAIYSREKSK